jgi:hypothetical protein
LKATDWVRVTSFDRSKWSAEYESADAATRPSSDTPLLQACLLGEQCKAAYGWDLAPTVALHGHALAEGAGEQLIRGSRHVLIVHNTVFTTSSTAVQRKRVVASCSCMQAAAHCSACTMRSLEKRMHVRST